MAIQNINDKQKGYSVRAILNQVIDWVNNAGAYVSGFITEHNTAAGTHKDIRKAVADEATVRQDGDANTLSAAGQEAGSKVAAHNADEAAHVDIRDEIIEGDSNTFNDAAVDAANKVAAHNEDVNAHQDIRNKIQDESTARQEGEQAANNKISTLNGTVGNLANDFHTHHNDAVRHVTPEDRARWDNREIAKVFDTLQEMFDWCAVPANAATLVKGQNLYIREESAPDYWWDGTQPLIQNSKTDFSDYYSKSEIDTKDEALLNSSGAYTDSEVAAEQQRAQAEEARKVDKEAGKSLMTDAERAKLGGVAAGADATATAIGNATEKTTPADSDSFSLFDGALKKIKWTNIKTALKGYFDSVYAAVAHSHTKAQIMDFPAAMPAEGGRADTSGWADSANWANEAGNASALGGILASNFADQESGTWMPVVWANAGYRINILSAQACVWHRVGKLVYLSAHLSIYEDDIGFAIAGLPKKPAYSQSMSFSIHNTNYSEPIAVSAPAITRTPPPSGTDTKGTIISGNTTGFYNMIRINGCYICE